MNLLLQVVVDEAPHPTLTSDGSWAGVMIILILGLVLAATAVGIVVRIHQPPGDENFSR